MTVRTTQFCVKFGNFLLAVGALSMSCQNHDSVEPHFIISGGNDKIIKKWNLPVKLLHVIKNSSLCDLPASEGMYPADSSNIVLELKRALNRLADTNYYNTDTATELTDAQFVYPQLILQLSAELSVKAHDKDVTTIAISPDNALVATASQDKTIKLWSTDKLLLISTLTGHKRCVWKVSFSPIDKVMVSCSADRTLKLWSLADYSCIVSPFLHCIVRRLVHLCLSVYRFSAHLKGTQRQS